MSEFSKFIVFDVSVSANNLDCFFIYIESYYNFMNLSLWKLEMIISNGVYYDIQYIQSCVIYNILLFRYEL